MIVGNPRSGTTFLHRYLATNVIVRLYSNQKPIIKLARKSLLRLASTFWPVKNAIIDELSFTET